MYVFKKKIKLELFGTPLDPRELETLGCCWGGAPCLIGCGVAKCCWWQVFARGGSPSTLLKFSLKGGGPPKFIEGPHPTGEHQPGLNNTVYALWILMDKRDWNIPFCT